MRSAKIAASDTVARNSGALRREDVADGLDIRSGKCLSDALTRAQSGRHVVKPAARPPCE